MAGSTTTRATPLKTCVILFYLLVFQCCAQLPPLPKAPTKSPPRKLTLSPRQAAMTPASAIAGPRSDIIIASRLNGITNYVYWGQTWTTNIGRLITVNATNLPSPPTVNAQISWSYPDNVRTSTNLIDWTTNREMVTASLSVTNSGIRFYQVPVRSETQFITVYWDSSPSPDIISYTVYFGNESRNYTGKVSGIDGNSQLITGLEAGGTYYFTVTATDGTQTESLYANEISITFPLAPVKPEVRLTK